MKSTDKIEKLIRDSRYKATPEAYDKTLQSILQSVDGYKKQKSVLTEPKIWRIVMNSKITRITAAAAVLMAVGLLGVLFDKTTPSKS